MKRMSIRAGNAFLSTLAENIETCAMTLHAPSGI
jgi:hypothetical protein